VQRIDHNGWHLAVFRLSSDALAQRVQVGRPVSIGFSRLRHDELPLLRDARVMRHTICVLKELSILERNEPPAFVGAKITERLKLPAKRTPSTPPPPPPPRSSGEPRPSTTKTRSSSSSDAASRCLRPCSASSPGDTARFFNGRSRPRPRDSSSRGKPTPFQLRQHRLASAGSSSSG
jgi:hypothetical protein